MVARHAKVIAILVIVLIVSSAQCVAGCTITPCQNEEATTSNCHQSQDGKNSRVPHGSCSHDEAAIEAATTKAFKADGVLLVDTPVESVAAIETLFSVTAAPVPTLARPQHVLSTTVLKI